ncbi:MAG: cytochrome c biogenesis protein CcdA [Flavobacteriales bacterium]
MKHLKILFLFTLITNLIYGQKSPVKWDFDVKKVSDCDYQLIWHAHIDKTWHIYSQLVPEGPLPTIFTVAKGDYQLVGGVQEPKGHTAFDEGFKVNITYHEGEVEFVQNVHLINDKEVSINTKVEWACCQSDGNCLPPDEVVHIFKLNGSETCSPKKINLGTGEIKFNVPPAPTPPDIKGKTIITDESGMFPRDTNTSLTEKTSTPNLSKYSFKDKPCTIKYSETKDESNWWLFLLAFGAGIFALLTPCVFPMIPMTVSFFLNDAESKKHGKSKAVFFGISIIAIFCLIGTLFSLAFGGDAANLLATHWIPNLIFFLIFIVFAASFFGLFEITLPRRWIDVADKNSDKGGYVGVFFMAMTTVLVSFSCTGPIAGSLLLQASEGELLTPLIGMLGFSSALAIPFTLFAFFPSMMRALPKSGGWLNSVKIVFGFLELALALKFLSTADLTEHWGILDRDIFIALWIVIFSLLGAYLLGWIKFSHDAEVKKISVFRLGLVISVFSFVFYLIPGLFGAPLKFLSGFIPPMSTHDFNILQKGSDATHNNAKYSDVLHAPLGINAFFDYEEGMAAAEQLGKPVLLDFTGLGCTNCRKIEDNVWTNPEVLKVLKEDYVVISLYVDERTITLPKEEQYTSKLDGKLITTLAKKNADIEKCWFDFNAQPFYVLMDNNEQLLNNPISYDKAKSVSTFLEFLTEGKAKYFKK